MPRGRLVGTGVAALLALAGAPSPAAAASPSPDQLYAFGYNGFGELGNAINTGQLGNPTNEENGSANPTPAPVALPGPSGPVTEIAAGQLHSLALTATGQLYAFGGNFAGQLGSGTRGGIEEANPTPTLVALPGASGPVTQIAAGGEHSLALTSTGQLYAFGSNQFGQLGIEANSGAEAANPTPTLVALPGAVGPVTQIAAGGRHSLVLTSTGQLYAFGDNGYGQLGDTTNNGTATPNPTPTLVTLPGAGGPVTEIAAGGEHSLALTSTGQLYAFGWNGYGQLGIETNSNTPNPNPTPALVTLPGAGGPATQIAAGGNHSLALTSTGQLYAFGWNGYGQLGFETNSGTETPNSTPALATLPGAVGQVTQIAAGRQDSLAVTSAGQLYAFGGNRYGQLGREMNSATTNPNPTPAPVTLPAGATVDAIARGPEARHTLALIAGVTVISASPLAGHVSAPRAATTTQSPTLTSASLTNRRFRVATQATAITARKAPLGTTFRFRLSATAKLQITLTRAVPGLRRGRSCLTPTASLKRTAARRCTLTLSVGTLARANEPQGADSLYFSGRVGHRALGPRAYKAILSASDAAGRSQSVTLPFVVVR